MSWIIIEQDEGYMVDTIRSDDIEVFFVDYDECKNGYKEYVIEKIEECVDSLIPQEHKDRIIKTLEGYL
jgi:hypothetical protein